MNNFLNKLNPMTETVLTYLVQKVEEAYSKYTFIEVIIPLKFLLYTFYKHEAV